MSVFSEIGGILNFRERRKIMYSLPLLTIGMLIEMASLGMIIPVIYVIIKPENFKKYSIVQTFSDFMGNPAQPTLVIYSMLILIFVFFIKTLYLIYLSWFQNKLLCDIGANVSCRLFDGYLKQSWVFHVQRNSAELMSNAIHEVNLFTQGVVMSMMIFLTEGLVFFGIVVVLFIIQPYGTLAIIGTALIATLVYQKLFSQWIAKWGEKRQNYDHWRTLHLQQGIGAIKDIKLMGREDHFSRLYREQTEGTAAANQRINTLQQLPRLGLELLAVSALAMLVLFMVYQNKPSELIFPVIGLFAAAAFRMIPSVNRIITSVHTFQYSLPSANKLYKEFKLLEASANPVRVNKLEFNHLITVENINYKFPNSDSSTIKDVNLQIPFGSSIGFIGTSGAGKSTLVDIILGVLTPTSGQVKVDGVDIENNLRAWQDLIGFVPQTIYLLDDSLRTNIAFGMPDELIDDDALQRAITAAQLDDFVKSLPEGLDTNVGERGVRLSGGQRQRIGIARALYREPKLLVLDESTNALDNMTENAIMGSVNRLKGIVTLVIIAHRLSTVTNCSYLYKIEKGKIVAEGDFDYVTKE